jgi:hypothetical protein
MTAPIAGTGLPLKSHNASHINHRLLNEWLLASVGGCPRAGMEVTTNFWQQISSFNAFKEVHQALAESNSPMLLCNCAALGL